MLLSREDLSVLPVDSKGRLSVFDDSDGNPCVRLALCSVLQCVLKSQAGDLSHLHLPVDHQPAEDQGNTHNNGYQDYHDLFPALSCFFHFLVTVFPYNTLSSISFAQ